MSSTSIDKGKSRSDDLTEDMTERVQTHPTEKGQENVEEGEDQNTPIPTSTPMKKKNRQRSKKNKGKAKDTSSLTTSADTPDYRSPYAESVEDEGEPEYEKVEVELFTLPDEFPFKESIAAMPEEQQRAKLQELEEFMDRLRNRAAMEEQKAEMRRVMELLRDMNNKDVPGGA